MILNIHTLILYESYQYICLSNTVLFEYSNVYVKPGCGYKKTCLNILNKQAVMNEYYSSIFFIHVPITRNILDNFCLYYTEYLFQYLCISLASAKSFLLLYVSCGRCCSSLSPCRLVRFAFTMVEMVCLRLPIASRCN